MDKSAKYNDKIVYVYYVDRDKQYAIVSYSEEGIKKFKADMKDLTDHSIEFQAELKREHYY